MAHEADIGRSVSRSVDVWLCVVDCVCQTTTIGLDSGALGSVLHPHSRCRREAGSLTCAGYYGLLAVPLGSLKYPGESGTQSIGLRRGGSHRTRLRFLAVCAPVRSFSDSVYRLPDRTSIGSDPMTVPSPHLARSPASIQSILREPSPCASDVGA